MPVFGWHDLVGSAIENSKHMEAVAQLPSIFIESSQSDRLFSEHLRDIDEFTAPLDFTIVTDLPNADSRFILNLGKLGRIRSWRGVVKTGWRLSVQCLMRALAIILLEVRIIVALLLFHIGLRCDVLFQGSMYALMATVLSRLTWANPLGLDPQFDPPFRKLTDPAHGHRSKRHPVISTHRLRQPVLPKDPLKPGSNRLIGRVLQRPAQKQVSREIVGDGQRITAPPVTRGKVAFEIRTPAVIGLDAIAKRFA